MARINFEDDVEAQDEFWKLLPLLGGDRDRTIGKLVRFFRIAQKAYGQNIPMDESELREKEFGDMIESGWAVKVTGGYQALGADKHFDWYRQKVEAGRKGGLAKAENAKKPLAADGVATAAEAGVYPLAPVPAPIPVLAPVQKEKERNEIFDCVKIWGETLTVWGIPESAAKSDEMEIGRLIVSKGFKNTCYALLGARYEEKTNSFNPAKHPSISRFWKTSNFSTFVKLGMAAESQKAERAAVRSAIDTELAELRKPPAASSDAKTEVPPEKVSELLGRFSKSMPKESSA